MRLGTILLIATCLALIPAATADWPQWRGPNANGLSGETGLPEVWGPEENIVWRTALPGVGTSTPIIWEDQVILTMQIGKNEIEGLGRQEGPVARKAPGEEGRVEFLVRSYNRVDGALIWEHRFAAEGVLPATHNKHNLASPSCVTDGKTVYAWMGTGQIVALTMEGRPVWKRHIGEEYAPFNVRWGPGSSPTMYKEKLFLLCDHQATAYLLALDRHTGKELWKVDRNGGRSYTTPFVLKGARGDALVINSSERIDAYDPETGKHLWHAGEPNRVPVSTPVYHEGVLYTSRGYRSGPYMAVKTSGRGGIQPSDILWRIPTGAPYVSSLLYHGGLIYMATESGIGSCVDAASGKTLWKKRLGGYFSASPVAADGKVYLVNEEGDAFVLKAGREYHLLQKNSLGERTLASPAIAGGDIFLRTDEHLIRIGAR